MVCCGGVEFCSLENLEKNEDGEDERTVEDGKTLKGGMEVGDGG